MEEDNKPKSGIIRFIRILLIVIIIVSILAIGGISLAPIITETIKQNKLENDIIGSWTTDGYTVYEFYKDNKGALVLPIGTSNFNYKIEENRISIDFEKEDSMDPDYEFSFEDEKLIFKGINNTSGTYTFTRNDK